MPHPEPSRLAMELLHAAYNATGQDAKLTPIVMTYAACMAWLMIERDETEATKQVVDLFPAARAHLREMEGEALN